MNNDLTLPDVPDLRHRRMATNGIELHAVEAGPEDGELVVLLHGFPEFWYGWRKQIGPLAAAGYRVLVPDQRGYNTSDKPRRARDYNMDLLAMDILGLVDALGCERFHLVGHDWGAVIAWFMALRHPERLHGLTVLNVPHPLVMRKFMLSTWAQMKKSWYIFFFQLPWLPEFYYRRKNFRIGDLALRFTSRKGTFSTDEIDLYRQAWAQPGALRGMINWYRASMRHPPERGGSPRIQVPVRMLWGVQDRFLGHEMIEPSLQLCDDGSARRFEEATHWLQHEEAEAVNAELLDFFHTRGAETAS